MDTTVYRKPTHTQTSTLIFLPITPQSTRQQYYEPLISLAVTRTQEEHIVSNALAQNGYPDTFIHHHSHTSHRLTSPLNRPPLLPTLYHNTINQRHFRGHQISPLTLEPHSVLQTSYDNFQYALKTQSPNKKDQGQFTIFSALSVIEHAQDKLVIWDPNPVHQGRPKSSKYATSYLAEQAHCTGLLNNWAEACVIPPVPKLPDSAFSRPG